MFIDEANIYVKAGDGGDGCNSFYRDRYIRQGKPDGGDGGRGGDVIIEADDNTHTLLDFQFRQHFRAKDACHGSGKNKKGKDGTHCFIKVPPGTIICDYSNHFLIRDLTEANERVIVAKGGKGGRGNQKAKLASKGEKGEEKKLSLELKLIAEVGIIGFPNVGKSSLVSAISNAHPKIANYPFTTRNPILGTVKGERINFRVVDIPGLIEGAHKGRGLGDKFLRHIERTHILIHLIDIEKREGNDPLKDYHALNQELKSYSTKLEEKPQLIAANKIDLPDTRENLRNFKDKVKKEVFPISALTGEGLEELLQAIEERLGDLTTQKSF